MRRKDVRFMCSNCNCVFPPIEFEGQRQGFRLCLKCRMKNLNITSHMADNANKAQLILKPQLHNLSDANKAQLILKPQLHNPIVKVSRLSDTSDDDSNSASKPKSESESDSDSSDDDSNSNSDANKAQLILKPQLHNPIVKVSRLSDTSDDDSNSDSKPKSESESDSDSSDDDSNSNSKSDSKLKSESSESDSGWSDLDDRVRDLRKRVIEFEVEVRDFNQQYPTECQKQAESDKQAEEYFNDLFDQCGPNPVPMMQHSSILMAPLQLKKSLDELMPLQLQQQMATPQLNSTLKPPPMLKQLPAIKRLLQTPMPPPMLNPMKRQMQTPKRKPSKQKPWQRSPLKQLHSSMQNRLNMKPTSQPPPQSQLQMLSPEQNLSPKKKRQGKQNATPKQQPSMPPPPPPPK